MILDVGASERFFVQSLAAYLSVAVISRCGRQPCCGGHAALKYMYARSDRYAHLHVARGLFLSPTRFLRLQVCTTGKVKCGDTRQ